jgi:hypothetical protein
MAKLTEEQVIYIKEIQEQLEYGLISSTDAGHEVGKQVFLNNSQFEPNDMTNTWRGYDQAMYYATLNMIATILK